MILEVALLFVKKGGEKQFEANFKAVGKYISIVEGYVAHSLRKCVE